MPVISTASARPLAAARVCCLATALLGSTISVAARASAVVPGDNPLPNDLHAMATTGGLENPEVIFAFNPQPDPPGDQTRVDLTNPAAPSLLLPAVRGSYELVVGFPDGGFTFSNVPNAPTVNAGVATFQFNADAADGSVFQVDLTIGGFVGSWSSFNPQPDPPGDIGFAFDGDPQASIQVFQITDNGDLPLSFSAIPEPGSLTLLGIAALGLSRVGRRRSRRTG